MIVDAFLFLSILSFLDNFTLFVNKTNMPLFDPKSGMF